MNVQYQFELVITRLILKKNLPTDCLFRISLLQRSKEVQDSSTCFQTEEFNLKKNFKIIDLDSLNSIKFRASKQTKSSTFAIKYEIKGNPSIPVQSIPINVQDIIHQFQTNKKSVFEEIYQSRPSTLQYKFYISIHQSEVINPTIAFFTGNVQTGHKQQTHSSERQKITNSISRGRPPLLDVSKSSAQVSRIKSASLNAAKKLLPEDIKDNGSPYLASNNSNDQKSSIVGIHKKISSIPLSEIQKVNELLATHQRPSQSYGPLSKQKLSYKLKIVIIMMAIGIIFLLYDTISDRSGRRARAKHQKLRSQKIHDSKYNKHEQRKGRQKQKYNRH